MSLASFAHSVRPAALVAVALAFAPAPAFASEDPWPIPAPGHVKPAAGEHPRLFFRKADVPKLRERAATPEGKAMVARLRELLGGGEQMPTEYNPKRGKQPDGAGDFHAKATPGKAYTLWHASGFGLLYQLTGEQKYADLAQECVAKALEGQRDRDNRYSFRDPGGALRAGPSVAAIAIAYDLAYDGWDDAFRRQVATALANYNEGQYMSLPELARGARHHPGSNHWGCQIGGAATALLAIAGDPGVDQQKVDELLQVVDKSFKRQLTEGFGDGGYFWEHAGPGQIASDTAFVPALWAMKVAGGLDYITPRPNASMVTMIRVYELKRKPGGGYHYTLRHPSTYGTQDFGREGLSRGGQFAQGFGAVDPKYRGAMLWTVNNVLEPNEKERTFDLISPYPHRVAMALAAWPLGEKEQNPAEVLPRVLHDTLHHYFVFRNRWQDENDILVTGLWGARKEKSNSRVMVWGLGEKLDWGTCVQGKPSRLDDVRSDGSGVATIQGVSLAVDFSKASGADALLVMVGPGAGQPQPKTSSNKVKTGQVQIGGQTLHWLSLSASGEHPEVKTEGEALVAGGQRVTFADGRLHLAK